MKILIIPIVAFISILTLVILKEIKPDSVLKKAIKGSILLFYVLTLLYVIWYFFK